MKIKLIFIAVFINTVISYSQQIGNGYATYFSDFTLPLLSGLYNGPNPLGKTPDNSHDWQYLFTIRHGNPDNNHQLQIASSFNTNDRLFFRKIAGSLVSQNPDWIELATRGVNNFAGDQVVNGTVTSSISNDTGGYISLVNPTKGANGKAQRWSIFNMTGGYGNSLQFWAYDNLGCGGGMCTNRFTIMDNGNVGIGMMNPSNKLDVNGTIHSKEVKVDMIGWSDFVFKKEYSLPTLEEVEKQIIEKGHLSNIPSEEDVLKNGINLGEMNAKLLAKVEELTLYLIEMKKDNEEVKKENIRQNEKIKYLENQLLSK